MTKQECPYCNKEVIVHVIHGKVTYLDSPKKHHTCNEVKEDWDAIIP